MRQIGTVPDERQARALSDYLLTQSIATQLTPEGTGWEIWVCDEDRIAQAREAFDAFVANPADPRFAGAATAATDIRRAEQREEDAFRRRQAALDRKMRDPNKAVPFLTIGLVVVCVAVALVSWFGEDNWLTRKLLFCPILSFGGEKYLFAVAPWRSGEWWRLFTPALLHFSWQHLGFNMLGLVYLGTQIEVRRGTWRLLALVLVLAAVSNVGQFETDTFSWHAGDTGFRPSLFGGMSGVLFGLFGYIWMKMRYEPDLGLGMSQQTFFLSLVWLVFCFTGLVGHIANGAHLTGLIAGMVIGAAPTVWRRLSGR